MKRTIAAVLTFVLAMQGSLPGQTEKDTTAKNQPWTAKEIRLVNRPDEIIAVLGNGLLAIVKANHTAAVTAVRLYVRTGSIYEQDLLGAGMSHLFEHLLAGGATETRTEEQSRQIIEQIGARHNAFTSKARTCYYITVPSEHTLTALELIADWVTRPTFPQDAFDREWAVVQRELEMRATNPQIVLWQLFDELRYKVHPAKYPIIGHQSIVQQLTREEILRYYRQRYVPDNTVVTVVGDINVEETLAAVKKQFADFTRKAVGNIVLPEEPPVTAPRRIVKIMPEMTGPAKIIMGFPSFKLQDEDLYAADMLANIMGQGRSSRLYRSLHEQQSLVLTISAGNYTPNWAEGTFLIMADLDPANLSATKSAIWQQIDRLKNELVNDQELQRAKKQVLVGHIREHQTAEQQAATMAEDYLSTGDSHFSDNYVENMQKVTAEQIRHMAQKYLLPEKQLLVVLSGKELPSRQDDQGTLTDQSAIKKITLDNGLSVLLKRNNTVPLVSMQLYVLGGLLDETDENNGLTNIMARLSAMGTESYTNEQIADYFDGIGGSLRTACGNNTFFYTAEVMAEDFAESLDIYSEVVIRPTFPQQQFDRLRSQILAAIDSIEDSWPANGARFFRKNFFVNSPYKRTSLGTRQSVESIDTAKISQFHHEHVAGNRAVLAVFGDIDLEEAEALVREKFSQMPAGEPLDLAAISPEPQQRISRLFVEDTQKNGATVHIGFPGLAIDNITDRYPLEVMTEIIGSSTGWLHERLRGEGLVYYAWGFSFPGVVPGYVAATAQCEAEQVPQIIELTNQLLEDARNGKFSDAELARAKSNLINSEILEKQTNADAAITACLDELYGLGYDFSEGQAERFGRVTIDQLQSVAKKYLSPPATVTIVTSKPEDVPEM